MMSATRNGKTYRPGDDGFSEAWRDNISDWVREWRDHDTKRMLSDPIYRARQEKLMDEYDRIFNPPMIDEATA